MILKSINLKMFQNFKEATFDFLKSNLIIGENGMGKTTIAVDSLLFCLYGYSNKSLTEIPTNGISKSCEVKQIFKIGKDELVIARKYPTSLKIQKNGKELGLSRIDAQGYINKEFGTLDTFRKFRMIDNSKGINILEQGKVALRKTLLSFQEDKFNNIRDRLMEKKRNRELYNKDKAVVYNIFPSEKRLTIINNNLGKLKDSFYKLEKETGKLEYSYNSETNTKGRIEGKLETLRWQKGELLKAEKCYACKQDLTKETKTKMLKEKNTEIKEINEKLASLIEVIQEYKEIIEQNKRNKIHIKEKIDKLLSYQNKLEVRIKQKEYCYTEQDILIMKEAINELDRLFSWYITNWIKKLEPIINSVIEKISFNVKFDLNDKGDVNIRLFKEGKEYSQKQLSEGQKLMLNIGFKLALLLEQGHTGLVIADEGFGALDSKNLNHIFKMFRELPFQLICIVHRFDEIPDGVNVINLEEK